MRVMENIPEQIRNKLQDNIKEMDVDKRNIVAVYLFGSNVRGEAGKKSRTTGTAGGLKNVNRSKRLKTCWPPERWQQFT